MRTQLTLSTPSIQRNTLVLRYKTTAGQNFVQTFTFSRNLGTALSAYPADRIAKLATFIALGNAIYLFNLEYYDEIVCPVGLTAAEIAFFEDFYFNGLAEFRLENNIPIRTATRLTCPVHTPFAPVPLPKLTGGLVANGGGKDGAVGAAIMREVTSDLSWFTWNLLGSRPAIIERSNIPESLVAHSVFVPSPYQHSPYSGHKPLNGALAFLAAFAALVAGKRYAIVSNEYSANEANLVHDGVEINHQYTKSFAVEQILHQIISDLGLGVYYFSVLRPLYELQIMYMLQDFPHYHDVFVSCNKGVKENTWCLACAKCAFVVLCLTAIDPKMAAAIWGDDLVVARPQLRSHIVALVAPQLAKPFECVGTLQECQLALGMIFRNASLLARLPASYRSELQPYVPAHFDTLYRDIMVTTERENAIPAEFRPAIYSSFLRHLRKH